MISRFRHTKCVPSSENTQMVGVNPCDVLWDGSNAISCGEKYVAIPWAGNGCTAVFGHGDHGRIPPNPPVFYGQPGAIIDSCFNPFNSSQLFSSSDEGNIFLWNIPAEGLHSSCSSPQGQLLGHSRKCGTIKCHPSCNGVLASAAADKLVNIWDVENCTARVQIKGHEDYATDLSWNLDGSLLSSVSKNKKLNIIDARLDKFVNSTESHSGVRSQRCLWAKRKNIVLSFGWDGSQRREIKAWDPRKFNSPVCTTVVDQSSSAPMTYFDEDTNLVMVASRGEGRVRCYELMEDHSLVHSFDAIGSEPAKGFCAFPKINLSVKECEIGRIYQLSQNKLQSTRLLVPRKLGSEEFQEDIFPPTFSTVSAIRADEYFSGKNSNPLELDLRFLFDAAESGKEVCVPTDIKTSKVEENTTSGNESAPPQKRVEVKHIHVDPSNMGEGTNRCSAGGSKAEIKDLLHKLQIERAAVKELRASVDEKEREISNIIDRITYITLQQ
ncbi:coronin [Angomonas deanei]|uniref:Coronin n=1 Tax=Angomonas deanei TaxID=59799 RepID=A0A7G2CP78_9TRYP|nr:coronin [Angomonas deanei]CAD2220754.1 Domain of unknown function (DUF1899)/Type of WD40 repeat, putative [Angomonas deanei]|eukprot:EPY27672.1 coronin [Angomonas deanei]